MLKGGGGGGGRDGKGFFFGMQFLFFVWFVGGLGWDVGNGNGVCSCWFELRDF